MKHLRSEYLYICLFLNLFTSIETAFSQAKPAYWQQHVAYTIQVRLDDNNHFLRADETVLYTNNAPNALSEIYFHLWPNGYRNNHTPFARQRLAEGQKDFHDAHQSERGFIDSLHFMADGKEIQIEYVDKSHEIARLKLNAPLQTGQSVAISTPFRVKIPKTFSRMGHSKQAYYISQWYPKPAVYDRNGWNTFPYLDQGEFYSEFGSFDVSITLPENYIVAATGRLVTPSEKAFMDNIAAKSDTSKTSLNSIDDLKKSFTAKSDFPLSSAKMKTIQFVQDSVHDFAWFADKRYLVEKTDTILPSGRKVTCWSMYTSAEKNSWKGSARTVAKTIGFYSREVGEYPYTSATAVSGDLMPTAGGMEYPMVTVISSKAGLTQVIVHEVGHNWFYGILGSNERRHPWMDEGINSFYDGLFFTKNLSLASYFKLDHKGMKLTGLNESTTIAGTYILQSRLGLDQPINLPAPDYTTINYGTIVYGKTPIIMRNLYFYLGKDEFARIMHVYFEKWKYRHPLPQDIREVFEKESSKDVSVFFGDYLNTDKKMDYAVSRVKKEGNNYVITLKNKGGIAAPVFAAIGNKDSILKDSVVYNPAKKYDVSLSATGEAGYVIINPFQVSPDVYFANNFYSLHPAIGRFKPLHFQTLIGIERPDKTNVLWTPVIAWNDQDRWMLGIGISSDLLPPKRFSYQLVPMYAFGSNMLAGFGQIAYSFNPYSASLRHFIEIGVNGKQFSFDQAVEGRYTKVQPFISWEFQQKPIASTMKHEIRLSSAYIFNHIGINEANYPVSDFPEKLVINEIQYSMHKGPFIRSFYAGTTFQNIQGITNRLTGEMILRRPSPIRNQQIYFRLFAGTLLGNTTDNPRYFIPLGGISGYQDFAYDNLYLDRTGKDRVFGQQIEPGGGFKFVSNSGAFSTNRWMATSSIAANIPKWPIKLYLDGGMYQDGNDKLQMEYSGGISFSILKDNFEVYFPLFYSDNIKNWMSGQYKGYGRQVTFRINFQALDPSKLIRSAIE